MAEPLITPLRLREVEFRNRVWLSPMCQYSAVDGVPQDWHLVHLGQYAVGGLGLVMAEATAVSAEGRISPSDTGLWNDEQAEAWSRIAAFVRSQGAAPGIQLAHAGRKASTRRPWEGTGNVGVRECGWTPVVGPSPVPFPGLATPVELGPDGLGSVISAFRDAACRADGAGFDVLEIHAAHGYLLHSFLSPVSNRRLDGYGGDFDNRVRLLLEVVEAVRQAWPHDKPLFVRVSGTDWLEDGWQVEDTVRLAPLLQQRGVDLMDCSSGGSDPSAAIPLAPGYQVPIAARVRAETGMPTAAVGLITEPDQAGAIVSSGQADAVLLARAMLRDPRWVWRAANRLGDDLEWPPQYRRARPIS